MCVLVQEEKQGDSSCVWEILALFMIFSVLSKSFLKQLLSEEWLESLGGGRGAINVPCQLYHLHITSVASTVCC